jgi:hypothetical protein
VEEQAFRPADGVEKFLGFSPGSRDWGLIYGNNRFTLQERESPGGEMLKKTQYILEFLKELQEESIEERAFSICAGEEDIPPHYTGLEVSLSDAIRWSEEILEDLNTCIDSAHDEDKTALSSLVEVVELIGN